MCVLVFMLHARTHSHLNPLHHLQKYFWKYFNIILPTTTCLPSCLFPYGFPTKTQYPFPFYPTHPTFPACPILRDFIARIIGQYKPKSHTLHNSSYTQQNSDYRYWSNSLWTAGEIRSYCLLKKGQLFTYCHHNPLRSDIALRPVWTTEENPALTVIRYEDRRTHSESLCRLHYRASEHFVMRI